MTTTRKLSELLGEGEQGTAGHTPGPWKVGGNVRKCEIGGFTTVEAAVNSPICYVAGTENAKLIAQAPTLAHELAQARAQIKLLREALEEIVEGPLLHLTISCANSGKFEPECARCQAETALAQTATEAK